MNDVVMDARQYARLPSPFRMWRGGELTGGVVAYETWGRLSPARDNAILVFTGLSASAHAAASVDDPSPGWWEAVVGPGSSRGLDTDRWFVVCVNSLGSCFGSTGPASERADGVRWGAAFPELSIEDIATAGHVVQRELGIERWHAVVGASLGGMSVLAFVARHPGAARRLVCISGTDAATPWAIALRSAQREAVISDPEWEGGHYRADTGPASGMRLARKIGTITYRSAEEWLQRFGRTPMEASRAERASPFLRDFAIQSYLDAQADRFVRTFDANCYLQLSRAMDRFDLAAHGGGSAQEALRAAGLERALVVGVASDLLFTLSEQRRVAQLLSHAGVPTALRELDSLDGHDAFLTDTRGVNEALKSVL